MWEIPVIGLYTNLSINEFTAARFKDKVAALRRSSGLGTKQVDECAFWIRKERVGQG